LTLRVRGKWEREGTENGKVVLGRVAEEEEAIIREKKKKRRGSDIGLFRALIPYKIKALF
jgi:hypothetical protein